MLCGECVEYESAIIAEYDDFEGKLIFYLIFISFV